MTARRDIAEWFGPPWWRPFARRRWRRLTDATVGANHWSAVHAAEADCMVGYIGPYRSPDEFRWGPTFCDRCRTDWGIAVQGAS